MRYKKTVNEKFVEVVVQILAIIGGLAVSGVVGFFAWMWWAMSGFSQG